MSRLLFKPKRRGALTTLPIALLAASCLDWQSLQQGRCGDRFVGREETCDDGNRWDGDGCNSLCQVESPVCGDGRLDPQEECDDGNLASDDGCGASCRVEVEVAAVLCGNSVLDAGEACDDGGSAEGDGCSRLCQLEPSPELCGNASLDDQEVCDDGDDANDDSCLNGCSRATCGDGFQRSGVEECDDGNVNNGDGCSRSCLLCEKTESSLFRAGNAHCYTVHPEPLTQAQARATCQAEGGELWSVTSDAEGADVLEKRMLNESLWLGLVTNATSSSWLGLRGGLLGLVGGDRRNRGRLTGLAVAKLRDTFFHLTQVLGSRQCLLIAFVQSHGLRAMLGPCQATRLRHVE